MHRIPFRGAYLEMTTEEADKLWDDIWAFVKWPVLIGAPHPRLRFESLPSSDAVTCAYGQSEVVEAGVYVFHHGAPVSWPKLGEPGIAAAYEIPTALPHLTTDDAAELTRLLQGVFGDDANSVIEANKWLTKRSDVFNCPPIDLVKRDELGVLRVISYLKQAPVRS